MTARPPGPSVDHLPGRRVVVAGLGISGVAAADALLERGASVVVVDDRDDERTEQAAQVLSVLGADVRRGSAFTSGLPLGPRPDLVVTSPGWRPQQPMLAAAAAAGVPVWGEVELAWRLRPAGAAPWLTLTGTNGKTTTVRMLAAMLSAAGLRAVAAGNVGTPVLAAVLDPVPYDVVAVELSSFQLHWSATLRPEASACLNVAPDHLDWHGSLEAYAAAKGRVYTGTRVACVYNAADSATEQLVRDADVQDGCRAIGFTLGVPAVGMLGVVDGVLADRAFLAERQTSALELAALADVAPGSAGEVPAPHLVANALAAAALARAHGVPPAAVREGLRSFTLDPHRNAVVARVSGVSYVDDSKATNPHAAAASLAAYGSVVWVAGGLAKGASFDDLVRTHAARMRSVVLIGRDREPLRDALARHAPQVPVLEVADGDTGQMPPESERSRRVMDDAVRLASKVAQPGDTVLLAPACASMDQFVNYATRGDLFAESVRALAARGGAA